MPPKYPFTVVTVVHYVCPTNSAKFVGGVVSWIDLPLLSTIFNISIDLEILIVHIHQAKFPILHRDTISSYDFQLLLQRWTGSRSYFQTAGAPTYHLDMSCRPTNTRQWTMSNPSTTDDYGTANTIFTRRPHLTTNPPRQSTKLQSILANINSNEIQSCACCLCSTSDQLLRLKKKSIKRRLPPEWE